MLDHNRDVGYNCPKYMIEAKGKTLFEWSMDSLIEYKDYVEKYVFVVREEDSVREFIEQKCIDLEIVDYVVIELKNKTDGQATTCMLALDECRGASKLLVYNIDTYVEPGEFKYNDLEGDGHIPCFHADGTHWSFVKLDKDGNAVEVKEKERISDNCSLGAYYFSSVELYNMIYNEYYIEKNENSCNEKYIAPMYDYMIKKGMKVTISNINYNRVHVLGTPEELEMFIND